jgi:hypothetical protein
VNKKFPSERDLSKGVRQVRYAAARRYGEECVNVPPRDPDNLDRIKGLGPYWRFKNCHGEGWIDFDPLIWRLDVWKDGCNGHAIFDLRKDCDPTTISNRLAGLDASIEYRLEDEARRTMWLACPEMDEIGLDTDLTEKITSMLVERAEEPRTVEGKEPLFGFATTRELLAELSARFEVQCLGGLDYRTVDEP